MPLKRLWGGEDHPGVPLERPPRKGRRERAVGKGPSGKGRRERAVGKGPLGRRSRGRRSRSRAVTGTDARSASRVCAVRPRSLPRARLAGGPRCPGPCPPCGRVAGSPVCRESGLYGAVPAARSGARGAGRRAVGLSASARARAAAAEVPRPPRGVLEDAGRGACGRERVGVGGQGPLSTAAQLALAPLACSAYWRMPVVVPADVSASAWAGRGRCPRPRSSLSRPSRARRTGGCRSWCLRT